ncbi:Crp/Fnr family transcriptional regulator [Limibacter armeniacum]|uniref:Crp/Fnr family transcriptional regulator n=1 Tax=Limibacter armeniacum TaxID=466084 RepID=UPI002FE66CFA
MKKGSASGFDRLMTFAKRLVSISEEEMNYASSLLKPVKITKNSHLIQEGQVCQHIAFINAGYLRIYYHDKQGEVTRDLNLPGTFITALTSFITQQPTKENIQAISDCELLMIHRDDVMTLYERYPKWERFGRLIIEQMYIEIQERLYAFISESAEERYRKLLENQPEILEHIPLRYVASYLGVTQPSLSRLRRQVIG